MDKRTREKLLAWAEKYNDPIWFEGDPVAFPRQFLRNKASLQDIEVAAIFAAHFAWGRRAMIIRDCERFFDYLEWKPYDYVMSGEWRNDPTSIHRTIKWSETAEICRRLRDYYTSHESLESMSVSSIREQIFGQKPDKKAPDKKIRLMFRWMVRNDGKVDLGLWKKLSPASLILPLDVHVYTQAVELGLTSRKQKDLTTAEEITEVFRDIFPGDPAKGDFALFGYGVDHA